MNLINKILLVAIFLIVLNYLTKGQVVNFINKIIGSKEGFNPLAPFSNNLRINQRKNMINSQMDYPQINYDEFPMDEGTNFLYTHLQHLINANADVYGLNQSNNRRIPMDDWKKKIEQILSKKLNKNGWTFDNLKLLDSLAYYENSKGREIEPFRFRATVSYNKKLIGDIIVYVEMFIRNDVKLIDDAISITNIRILKRAKQEIDPIQQASMVKNTEMAQEMATTMQNMFVNRQDNDDLFIKPNYQETGKTWINDSENSLIPSVVEFSNDYESETADETTD